MTVLPDPRLEFTGAEALQPQGLQVEVARASQYRTITASKLVGSTVIEQVHLASRRPPRGPHCRTEKSAEISDEPDRDTGSPIRLG